MIHWFIIKFDWQCNDNTNVSEESFRFRSNNVNISITKIHEIFLSTSFVYFKNLLLLLLFKISQIIMKRTIIIVYEIKRKRIIAFIFYR